MWAKIISFFMSIYLTLCGWLGITPKNQPPQPTEKTAVVQLVGNASTGFTWSYAIADESIAVCTGETSVYQGKDGVVGAPSDCYYTFEGLKAGTTVVTFTYQRSWEHEAPAKTASYQLTVDGDLNIVCTPLA